MKLTFAITCTLFLIAGCLQPAATPDWRNAVKVVSVAPGSAAAAKGIAPGDIVTAIVPGGTVTYVTSQDQLRTLLEIQRNTVGPEIAWVFASGTKERFVALPSSLEAAGIEVISANKQP